MRRELFIGGGLVTRNRRYDLANQGSVEIKKRVAERSPEKIILKLKLILWFGLFAISSMIAKLHLKLDLKMVRVNQFVY